MPDRLLKVPDRLLKVKDLVLKFYTYEGVVHALDEVNLEIRKGETLGVVGETGCGKSVTALSMLSIVLPPGKIENGHVLYETDGGIIDILQQKPAYLRKIRGRKIAMIFQEPRAALNPVYTVNDQVSEAILLHRKTEMVQRVIQQLSGDIQKAGILKRQILKVEKKIYERMLKNPDSLLIDILASIPIIRIFQNRLKKEARKEVIKLLKDMRIPDPERVANMYPHELSGGMAQRVVIAIALSCRPELLIADEPTTNLDVTVQAQILELLKELKVKYETALLYITHDMGVVAEICDRVAVMYAGNVVELGGVFEIFKNPLHPYTQALLQSIPRPGHKFMSIEGTVPSLINPPKGCRFHPRCKYAREICTLVKPKFIEAKPNHFVQCNLYGG